ncbi:MAG: molybdopterin-dependent oxidoreductase [Bacteroidota bacterium]
MSTTTQATACILCSQNCGIMIEQDQEGNFTKILGDKQHPISEGYLCQKATRLNYYQKQARLTSPLRRNEDGSFEEISWDAAVQEIADKLVHIRNTFGGTTIAYAGGGGQGNHLGGAFGSALRTACGTPYIYSALAQEKTGNFWVNGKLFGRQNLNYSEAVGEAEYVMIIGANPVQAHGIPKARPTINEISRNPDKTLVVVDPRHTETAKKADVFLQIKPGRDAFMLAAMLGHIIQNGLENQTFIQERTVGFDKIKPHFMEVPVAEYAQISGISLETLVEVAEGIAKARSFALRSDLGIEQSHNSTLNAYLARLLFLVTGHFGREGTNCLHVNFFPVVGHSKEPEEGAPTTKVTGMKGIGKLFPPNVLPLEIDTDHPDRVRALVVDSANPVSNYPDTQAHRKAFQKLDLLVVIDVAMTETAELADYVLPASTQYEKMESTFFNLEFPENFFHLRHPITPPLENTLPEPEIYHRIVTAMGEIPSSFPVLSAVGKLDRRFPTLKLLPLALGLTLSLKPKWKKYQLLILKETLGKALPYSYAKIAVIAWIAAHRFAQKYAKAVNRTGIKGKGYALGEALFNKILHSKSGTFISKHTFEEHWDLIRHKDKKVHLDIEELLGWLDELPEKAKEEKERFKKYPFNLLAGERRTYNANGIIRNPDWRKRDGGGDMKMHPKDAEKYDLQNGDWVICQSEVGEVKTRIFLTDEVPEGMLSMPHGYGYRYPNKSTEEIGVHPNELTGLTDCDPLAKTPYHKNVRVRLEKIVGEAV